MIIKSVYQKQNHKSESEISGFSLYSSGRLMYFFPGVLILDGCDKIMVRKNRGESGTGVLGLGWNRWPPSDRVRREHMIFHPTS